MPGDVGLGVVQALVPDELGQFRLGLAAQARFFLLDALGLDPFFLLALGADGVGLGEIDFLTRARLLRLRRSVRG